jgi:hypothetical protein
MPLTEQGQFGPTIRASLLQPPDEFHIVDCAILADSENGTGLLSCCDQGPGLIAVVGTLPPGAPQNATAWQNTKVGLFGSSQQGSGVLGMSSSSEGTVGSSDSGMGVVGVSRNNRGVYGLANNGGPVPNTNLIGVEGESLAPWGTGVYGHCDEPDVEHFGPGVRGLSTHGPGVLGESSLDFGVDGESKTRIGVYGQSDGDKVFRKPAPYPSLQTGPAFNYGPAGVSGIATGNGGAGVQGQSVDGPGIYGYSYKDYAGVFAGNVRVSGSLVKAGGGFRIDHPLHPERSYLNHAFVESSEMKNVYDGVAVLDAKGEAVVKLPDWVQALNADFRYQLTAIGAPAPNLHVAQALTRNHFKIGGGKARAKISWQITGVRKDVWANANPVTIEEPKPVRGYLHPNLFGKSAKGIDLLAPSKPTRDTQSARAKVKQELAKELKRPSLPTRSPLATAAKRSGGRKRSARSRTR